jgi:hypothetical protein
MAIKKTALFILPLYLLQSCGKEPEQQPTAAVAKETKAPEKSKDTPNEAFAEYLIPQQETLEGYTFRYGYTAYTEDEGSNPGYLEVLKNGKVVFKDTFEGAGEPHITALGHHNLNGDKLVFQLNYGIEACDYNQTAQYYVVDGTGKFHYINSYWSGTGGDLYATRYFTHIFPADSLGKPNTLTIVEGITYHEHDQPDVADTTHIVFAGNSFKLNKLSDNLGKAE